MTDEKNIVIFKMPDGTAVSNDPSWHGLDEARKKVLASREYQGHAGIEDDEMLAQTLTDNPATLNSGQPGVGEHSVPEDSREYSSTAGREALRLSDPAKFAELEAAGWPVPEGPEMPDSNEAVLEARKVKAEKAQAALETANQEPGDPDIPYEDWTAKQLKAEVASRNAQSDRAEEDQLKIPSGAKKPDVVALLEDDDERQAEAEAEDDESQAEDENEN